MKAAFRLPPIAALVMLCAALPGAPAAALSESNLMGKWCGIESSYAIGPKSMVVTRHSDSAQLIFEVVKIESREASLLVRWKLQGRLGGTEFGEFSSDGLNMAQLANNKGPRREFRRC
ncbi:MAG: hypothetical protein K2X43_13905 [Hyphomonadaceae bacterium]|nr:hypothetical protein [Hyphomonadaceae bacterium]